MLDIDDRLLIELFGLVFLALGVTARLGIWKGWYWRSKRGAYSYIPLSLAFFLSIWRPQLESLFGTDVVFYVIFVLLLLIGAWWTVRPPRFIEPQWIQWIEEQPKEVQKAMREEARESKEWRSRVESREDIDQWAKSLKRQLS